MLNVEFGCSLALNKPVQAIGTDANDWREKSWNNLSQNGPRHRWQGSQSRYRPIAPGNFTESFAPLGPVDSGSFFYAHSANLHSANLHDSVGLLVNLGYGTVWKLPGSSRLNFEISHPVHQDLDGVQLETDWTLAGSWSKGF